MMLANRKEDLVPTLWTSGLLIVWPISNTKRWSKSIILHAVATMIATISLCIDDALSTAMTSKKRVISTLFISLKPRTRRIMRCFGM